MSVCAAPRYPCMALHHTVTTYHIDVAHTRTCVNVLNAHGELITGQKCQRIKFTDRAHTHSERQREKENKSKFNPHWVICGWCARCSQINDAKTVHTEYIVIKSHLLEFHGFAILWDVYTHSNTRSHTHTNTMAKRTIVSNGANVLSIRESALVVGFWSGETHQAMGKPPKVSGGRVVCGWYSTAIVWRTSSRATGITVIGRVSPLKASVSLYILHRVRPKALHIVYYCVFCISELITIFKLIYWRKSI